MKIPSGCHLADSRPGLSVGIIKFHSGDGAAHEVLASCDEKITVWQQSCRVPFTFSRQRTGKRPLSGGGVIEFRTSKGLESAYAARDENLAIRQECRRVVDPSRHH